MPLEPSDFPEEVLVAFFIYGLLSDVWDGMSGMYMGKDWSQADQLFKLYEVDDPKVVMFFAKMYERVIVEHRAKEAERKRKAQERRAGGSTPGRAYTHKVSG